MPNDRKRKRAIRAYMKETGLNYTAAMQELDKLDAEANDETEEAP